MQWPVIVTDQQQVGHFVILRLSSFTPILLFVGGRDGGDGGDGGGGGSAAAIGSTPARMGKHEQEQKKRIEGLITKCDRRLLYGRNDPSLDLDPRKMVGELLLP